MSMMDLDAREQAMDNYLASLNTYSIVHNHNCEIIVVASSVAEARDEARRLSDTPIKINSITRLRTGERHGQVARKRRIKGRETFLVTFQRKQLTKGKAGLLRHLAIHFPPGSYRIGHYRGGGAGCWTGGYYSTIPTQWDENEIEVAPARFGQFIDVEFVGTSAMVLAKLKYSDLCVRYRKGTR